MANGHGLLQLLDAAGQALDRTRVLLAQPVDPVDGVCSWEIIDKDGFDAASAAGKPIGIYDTVLEFLTEADAIEELGEKIQAPHLAASIQKYNDDLALPWLLDS